MAHCKMYISSPIKNKKVILNDILRDFLFLNKILLMVEVPQAPVVWIVSFPLTMHLNSPQKVIYLFTVHSVKHWESAKVTFTSSQLNQSRSYSPLKYKVNSIYPCKQFLLGILPANIINWISWSFSNSKRFGCDYM